MAISLNQLVNNVYNVIQHAQCVVIVYVLTILTTNT